MHRSAFRALLVVAALALWVRAAVAVPVPNAEDLVHAKLLADTTGLQQGKPFLLGVLLEIKPGWHIYWQNPGDSGSPTVVNFTVPEGYAIRPLAFPVPQKIVQPGDEVVYGYTGSVLFIAEVKPPRTRNAMAAARDVAEGMKASLSAEVSWLCCEKLCMPGKSTCQLKLPTGGDAQGDNAALFAEWKARVPAALGDKDAPATGTVTPTPTANAIEFSVVLQWSSPPAQVEFFAAPQDAMKLIGTKVETAQSQTTVHFKAVVLKGEKLTASKLTTVVAAKDDKGAWRGVLVECPVDQLMPK